MKKFIAYFQTGAGFSVEIEAKDYAEAEIKAWKADIPSLCHQCADINLGDWETDSIEEVS